MLPVFAEGGRGCWVDLSANDRLTPEVVLAKMGSAAAQPSLSTVRVLHLGYPHLLRHLRGAGLAAVLQGGAALIADTSSAGLPLTCVAPLRAALLCLGRAQPRVSCVATQLG